MARRTHLRRVAYALCGDWHQSEDLLQTAFAKLYAAWPKVHRHGDPEPYVRRILVNAHIDEVRRPRSGERPMDTVPDVPVHDPADHSDLFAAIQALPLMQRRVVVLRHWLGLSVRETAHELGITEGTVKSHSSRALSTLQDTVPREFSVSPDVGSTPG